MTNPHPLQNLSGDLDNAPVSITGRRIRVALAGCGRISRNHFAAIKQFASELELVGICDTAAAALDTAINETGVPGYDSLGNLLRETDADLVVLATPSGLHSRQTMMVAAAGRHVVTEKPMATRWHDALRMVQACDQAGVRLFVVKQNRLNTTLQLLKRAICNGRFGRIHSVAINVFWSRPQEYYDSAAWRGTWEFDGGAFMNQASHYIDLLDWLVGPVESVMAYTGTLARNIEVEDCGVACVKWRNGAMGTINVTMLTYPRNMEGSITILGDRGSARVGGMAVNEIQHWEFADRDPMDDEVESASYGTESVYGHGHSRYYRNVIDVLRGRSDPETDGREGLRSLELLVAMYLAARDGRRVSLPLDL